MALQQVRSLFLKLNSIFYIDLFKYYISILLAFLSVPVLLNCQLWGVICLGDSGHLLLNYCTEMQHNYVSRNQGKHGLIK